jgi:hypothetical protein
MLKTRIFALATAAALVATAACAREEGGEAGIGADTAAVVMPPATTDPAMGTGTMGAPMDTMGMGTTGAPMDTMGMGTTGTTTDTTPRP